MTDRAPWGRSADEIADWLTRLHREGRAPTPRPARAAEPSRGPDDLLANGARGVQELYTRARAHLERREAKAAEVPEVAEATAPPRISPVQIDVRSTASHGSTAIARFALDNDTPRTARIGFRPSELRCGAECRWAHVRFNPPRLTLAPHDRAQVVVEVDLDEETGQAELDVEVCEDGRVKALVWLTIQIEGRR